MTDEIRSAQINWRGLCYEDDRGRQVRRNSVGSITVEESYVGDGVGWRLEIADTSPTAHALAALCLYQQPFGFTRQDVEALEDVLGCSIGTDDRGAHVLDRSVTAEAFARLESLAARIAALLPPEEPR